MLFPIPCLVPDKCDVGLCTTTLSACCPRRGVHQVPPPPLIPPPPPLPHITLKHSEHAPSRRAHPLKTLLLQFVILFGHISPNGDLGKGIGGCLDMVDL